MSNPAGAKTTSRGRVYTRKGRNYWSVTTIIKGGLPAPALMGWGMRSVAEYAVANHRQIAAMLGAVSLQRVEGRLEQPIVDRLASLFGATRDEKPIAPFYVVSDPDAVEAAVKWLSGAPYRERDRKADVGSAVHAQIEAIILGKPRPEPMPDVAPFLLQFDRFVADFSPSWEASEGTIYSDKESYAGTLDWIATIGGRRLIGDTKTGKGVYPEAALQLAAYAHADYLGLADGTDAPLPAFDGGVVLHLSPDAYQLVPVRIDDDVFRAFLFAREVFRWAETISKTVLGTAIPGPDGIAWVFDGPAGEPAEVA
ncbi:MAG TPA: hypothetical protein VLM76_08410 [Patescibacteria group bacterium]|nr:hypothetical protein [Patescibacteria group bacterium]